MTIRLSTPDDIPALRRLWELAFGDSGPYLDNFFHNYYRPERMIVLEHDGSILSMTAWFDTTYVLPGQGDYRAAYLYAVATHPDCRSQGLSGKVLAWADDYFTSLGISAVTTVPAQPSLHKFFGANGFEECFTLCEVELRAEELSPSAPVLRPVDAAEYGRLREQLLSDSPHISYPEDALTYQKGCCTLSGCDLFAADTPDGPAVVCAEGAGNGLVVIKEFLGSATAGRLVLPDLMRVTPAGHFLLRTPVGPGSRADSVREFAMLKWLKKPHPIRENGQLSAHSPYLGLAFD